MRFELLPLAEARRFVGLACQHCGKPSEGLRKGRCHPCYQYFNRTGRDRPAYLLDPSLAPGCSECGEHPVKARGRCARCYLRLWRRDTGRTRVRSARAPRVPRRPAVLLPPVVEALDRAHRAATTGALPAPQEAAFERAHQRGPIVCLYTHEVLGLTHATCPICQRLRAEGRSHACTSNPWET